MTKEEALAALRFEVEEEGHYSHIEEELRMAIMALESEVTGSVLQLRDIETLCICAVRYSLGRQTYMPSVVQNIVRSCMSKLSTSTLGIIAKSVKDAEVFGGYGDEKIDKPGWIDFLKNIELEVSSRSQD